MPSADRRKWDERYAEGDAPLVPSVMLTSLDHCLPRRGAALDVAGGGGRHGLWLAARGLDVTITDVSPRGLEIAGRRATEQDLSLELVERDLELDGPPEGAWDVIVSFHFLCRPLLARLVDQLRVGGWLVVLQSTVANLQRHARPPAAYLLNVGELLRLAADLPLDPIRYEEGWLAEGRHDAFLVARRLA